MATAVPVPTAAIDSSAQIYDAALGAVLGACIGDAAGAPLEFKAKPTRQQLESAIAMAGGGIWKTAPGQITDDGELTLSLARALAISEDAIQAKEYASDMYKKWFLSEPFDIGTTTRAAFGAPQAYVTSVARGMIEAAAAASMQSKANGSLMRAVPLAIWGYRLSDEDLVHVARNDSMLSHPNPAVQSAVAAYVLAVASLLQKPGNRAAAWGRVANYAASPDCDAETRAWIKQAEQGIPEPFKPNEGFVKIAFVNALLHLRRGSDFLTAIKETLAGAGDADTNTCIAGGLIGAAESASRIPVYMREAVLTCDISKGGQPHRPDWLSTRMIPDLVRLLLAKAPLDI